MVQQALELLLLVVFTDKIFKISSEKYKEKIMRADIENLVASIEKTLELLRQRMDWDTASSRLEEFNARVEDPNL